MEFIGIASPWPVGNAKALMRSPCLNPQQNQGGDARVSILSTNAGPMQLITGGGTGIGLARLVPLRLFANYIPSNWRKNRTLASHMVNASFRQVGMKTITAKTLTASTRQNAGDQRFGGGDCGGI
jgi:hypothetical protein